jgi:hypothetical protein
MNKMRDIVIDLLSKKFIGEKIKLSHGIFRITNVEIPNDKVQFTVENYDMGEVLHSIPLWEPLEYNHKDGHYE